MTHYLSMACVLALLAGLSALLGGTSAAADDDKDWGTIKGRIVWGGDKAPDPVELKVDKDQAHCLEKGKLFSEEWVVDKDIQGREVGVRLAGARAGLRQEAADPSVAQGRQGQGGVDRPALLPVRPARAGHARGPDPGRQEQLADRATTSTTRAIRSATPARTWPWPPRARINIEGLKADDKFPITVACNIHGWMKAYVRVFDHPYFAVTDKDGNFEIKNAPAGEWRLKIWHDTGWRGGAARHATAKRSPSRAGRLSTWASSTSKPAQ